MALSPYGVNAALDRLLDRPLDRLMRRSPIPPAGNAPSSLVLAAYCGLWTLYGAIAKGSQDIHFDMGEMVAWSRETLWGTPKHPPLGAWLVRAWFSVFPLADWAYYLFAMVARDARRCGSPGGSRRAISTARSGSWASRCSRWCRSSIFMRSSSTPTP